MYFIIKTLKFRSYRTLFAEKSCMKKRISDVIEHEKRPACADRRETDAILLRTALHEEERSAYYDVGRHELKAFQPVGFSVCGDAVGDEYGSGY